MALSSRQQQAAILREMAQVRRRDAVKVFPEEDRPFIETGLKEADACEAGAVALASPSACTTRHVCVYCGHEHPCCASSPSAPEVEQAMADYLAARMHWYELPQRLGGNDDDVITAWAEMDSAFTALISAVQQSQAQEIAAVVEDTPMLDASFSPHYRNGALLMREHIVSRVGALCKGVSQHPAIRVVPSGADSGHSQAAEARLSAQGSPTCATCEHFEVNAAEAFSFCGDVKPNPMSYKETTATFGCIFHAPRPSSTETRS